MSMAKVIESIERESFERSKKLEDKMTLVEYAEKIAPFPLSDFQKELFKKYEQCLKRDESLYVIPSRNVGKEFVLRVIEEWKRRNELQEHRCLCGRLLGKFAGQAEVKCPKCGKVNVIGGIRHGDC